MNKTSNILFELWCISVRNSALLERATSKNPCMTCVYQWYTDAMHFLSHKLHTLPTCSGIALNCLVLKALAVFIKGEYFWFGVLYPFLFSLTDIAVTCRNLCSYITSTCFHRVVWSSYSLNAFDKSSASIFQIILGSPFYTSSYSNISSSPLPLINC